jgi:8-oxo-dGTP pyrophosphatase MutT (NUDIX family)
MEFYRRRAEYGYKKNMKRRPAARLLPIDEEGRLLLFRFVINNGPSAGDDYWATAGGAVEEGESFAEAARRELTEETGFVVEDVGEPVAERKFVLQLLNGEKVMAEEQFFKVRVVRQELSFERWTDMEKEVIADHRWWSLEELQTTRDIVYPENLVEMLRNNNA